MTALAFHFGAPDKLGYACRLLRKAVASGAQAVVVADAESIAQLDTDLWALSATEFLPHCVGADGDSVVGALLVEVAGARTGGDGEDEESRDDEQCEQAAAEDEEAVRAAGGGCGRHLSWSV